jgi:BirA family transcriptional regulator, biotin operon repressor / biotin---[acetyl-CoA-carboxylase] ligase
VLTIELLSIEQIRRRLTTVTVGRVLHLLGEVDSTNARCRDLARAGAPEGTVVMAEGQRSGRGRSGQAWFSPSGVNLYASVLLRQPLRAWELPLFSFLASLALVDTFDEYGARAGIKWPNDVVVNGKKVAGTLVESAMRGEDVQYTVLGVEVNLNVEPDVRRAVLGSGFFATSLAALSGHEVDRNAFAAAFLNRLDEWLEVWKVRGAEAVRSAWATRDVLTGKHVELRGTEHGRRSTLVSEEVRPS